MEQSQSIRPLLDKIERPIAKYLKSEGFIKKGRTFNKETEKGIMQVINLQSGTFPIGKYEIPGVRESKYGEFTVNLGVGIDEIYKVTYPKFPIKSIWKDYECVIRERLGILLYSKDYWWTITNDTEQTANEIIEGLKSKGIPWLDLFETREKISENFTSEMAIRAKLDVALIAFFQDKDKGIRLLQEYYDGPNSFHRTYVYDLAKSIGVTLKTSG